MGKTDTKRPAEVNSVKLDCGSEIRIDHISSDEPGIVIIDIQLSPDTRTLLDGVDFCPIDLTVEQAKALANVLMIAVKEREIIDRIHSNVDNEPQIGRPKKVY
jgi:hypothetical protein